MTRHKILMSELFGEVVSSYIQAHPTDESVFTMTGDDQLLMCRFDWEKDESVTFGQTDLPESIGCVNFSSDGTRVSCASRSAFYSMDSEVLNRAVDKRVFPDPIVCIEPFNISNQSYNLVLGDEAGNLHLIDSRESTAIKDRMFKSRTDGVSISSMAVCDKIVYIACENGIVEAFDLKKRGFIRDYEFSEKMLTHIFIDDRVPVVSTDEGEILWLNMDTEQVLYKAKQTDLLIERVTPISDEFALVKPMAGDNLMLLSMIDHKFVGVASSESVVDVASSCDDEQIIASLEKNGHLDVEIWDTKEFIKAHTPRTSRPNGNENFFAGLSGDDDQ